MTQRQGAPGIEPGTSRSAVECSTTELYPLREDGKRFSHVITLHLSSHHRTPSSAFSPAPALTTGLTLIAHTHTHTRARARSRTHQADTASAACACIQHSFVRMHVPASSVCLVLSRTRQAHGVLAQMVERSLSMREVLGSMPRYSIRPLAPLHVPPARVLTFSHPNTTTLPVSVPLRLLVDRVSSPTLACMDRGLGGESEGAGACKRLGGGEGGSEF